MVFPGAQGLIIPWHMLIKIMYDGYVLNSQFSNFNTDGTIGIHRKWGYTQLHASYFDMQTGIVDGTRDSASGKLGKKGCLSRLKWRRTNL